MNKQELILKIKVCLKQLDVNKAILFGSYSTNTQKKFSDIDLLVVTNDKYIPDSFSKKMELKLKISKALDFLRDYTDLDLIVHTKPMHDQFINRDSAFKKEIFSTGTIIYEGDN